MTAWTPEEEAAIARRTAALDDDPWFLALSEEDKCEAYTIAALLALHDLRTAAQSSRDVKAP